MSGMRRAFNDAFAFGRASNVKANSKVEKKFADCLPAADWPVYDENGDLRGFKGWHVFGSETARLHFIKHGLILLSANGEHDLGGLNFDNFFARSYDKSGVIWYTASIVATKPGDFRILHSIVATRAGTSKTAAFQLLMLNVETKLDAVLRGNGTNSGGLPAKTGKAKESAGVVSIISTPSEAMTPPKATNDNCNTWSGAQPSKSPNSKASMQFSHHSSNASQSTQGSSVSSTYSQASQYSQSTVASTAVRKPSRQSWQQSSASTTATPRHLTRNWHVSTPLRPATLTPTPKTARHVSQPIHPRSSSTPPTATGTLLKTLPALPRGSTAHFPTPPPPERIHPALRSTSSSTEALKGSLGSTTPPSLTSSSVYSRSPVSPLSQQQQQQSEKEVQMQPLHIEDDGPGEANVPSPLHFEKPVATIPARLLRQQTEFEIYA